MKHLIILLLPICLNAQKAYRYETPKLKEYKVSILFTFLAGASDGARDGFMFHSDGANNWFNGKQSWNNKYKNRDPLQGEAFLGSTTIFVAATDAPHAANTLTHQFDAMSMLAMPYDPNKRFTHLLLKAAIITAVRGAGRTIIYNGIFKPKN